MRHIVGERHPNIDAFLGALNSKGDVVGEGKYGIGAQLVGQLKVSSLDNVGRERQNRRIKLLKQRQIMLVNIVKGALDSRELEVARLLVDGKGDSLAEGDNASPLGVDAHHGVVVDSFDDFHRLPSQLLHGMIPWIM